jgi:outer membrane protein assembly factor BamE (lipoprotein component of BamABCDE complex)
MVSYRLTAVALTAITLALTGCATITRGTTEVLVVNTDPPGAQVQISDGHQCSSPCSVELKRKHDYHVKIVKAGYEPIETDVKSQIVGAGAAGMAGNVLVGGLIGVGVDAYTGATKGLKPNPLTVNLAPVNGSQVPSSLGTTVLTNAATVASLAAVSVETMCTHSSKVDQAECRGTLKMGMTRDEILRAIGAPDGKSADERTLRFGDRYLEFDDANRLTKISEVKAL